MSHNSQHTPRREKGKKNKLVDVWNEIVNSIYWIHSDANIIDFTYGIIGTNSQDLFNFNFNSN